MYLFNLVNGEELLLSSWLGCATQVLLYVPPCATQVLLYVYSLWWRSLLKEQWDVCLKSSSQPLSFSTNIS